MTQAVLDAIWRAEPDDQDAQRLITLMQQHSLPPENLRILIWGGRQNLFHPKRYPK
jgi:hypothetical protein